MMTSQTPVLPDVFTDPASGQRINLLDYKARNVRASWLMALITMALLAAIAYLLATVTGVGSSVYFVGTALVIGAGQGIVGFWFSDKIALAASGARKATAEEHRYLVNVTEAVAIGAGVPMPGIYVIDSPAPNAFATGRDPQHSSIAVSRGMLQLLDRQELEGVIAHEMAHIRNYDIRFMSMLVATLGAILVLRDLVGRWTFLGGIGSGSGRRRSSDRGGDGARGQGIMTLLLIVLLVLAPILATLLRLAVNRRREYLADATGAYITRNPDGLASALEKLRAYRGPHLEVSEGVKHMFFVNPSVGQNNVDALATHPPIEERISRLRRM
jgi:heat shock protein HtpX